MTLQNECNTLPIKTNRHTYKRVNKRLYFTEYKLKEENLHKDIFGGVLPTLMPSTLPPRIDSKSLASDSLILFDFMTAEGEKKARLIKHTSVIVSFIHSGDLSKRHVKQGKEK